MAPNNDIGNNVRNRWTYTHAPYSGGSWYYNGGWLFYPFTGQRQVQENWCEDVDDNPGGNNPLTIVHYNDEQEGITGSTYYSDGHVAKVAENLPNGWARHWINVPNIPTPHGATLAARMSPAKPLVDLPLFLYELKDIASMKDEIVGFGKSLKASVNLIRHAYLQKMAESAARQVTKKPRKGFSDLRQVDWHGLLKASAENLGGFNLSYSFGWAPLASDIATLTGFATAFERRKKQLQRLYDPNRKGLRRRITLGTFSDTTFYESSYLGSTFDQAFAFWGTQLYTLESEKWATSRWKPQPWNSSPPPQDSDWDNWSVAAGLLGLNVSLDTAWNAIPFTWAADYFSNIGDFMALTRNITEFYCESVSVMQRSKGVRTISITGRSWDGTGGGGVSECEVLQRDPTPIIAFPTFEPFLALSQVSNLASLSVAKRSAWRN